MTPDSGPPGPSPSSPDDLTRSLPDASLPAFSISGYRWLRLLGAGGMGAVYLAEDEALGRRVAIKILGRSDDEASRQRFKREARTMASVDHPNVVRVYAFGSAGGNDYLVMEYVEGETLAGRLRRAGALDEAEARRLLREVVQGLAAAWEQGIVHRDVKPSNILLDARGRARVADFGLARSAAHVAADGSITGAHEVVGTLSYLSPEQAHGQAADCRSDIYSLGLVLYEMLTGHRLFGATTPLDALAQRLHGGVPDLRRERPGTSPALAALFEWMTQGDPQARPASWNAILDALDADTSRPEARNLRDEATPGRDRNAPAARRGGVRLSTKVRAALAGGILLVVAACVVFVLSRARHPVQQAQSLGSAPLTVAVTPFYGPDDDSTKEGRVTAALVERAVSERLGNYGVKVLGLDETRTPVKTHDAARALGERLQATVVIWGEAFTLRGETEIQPYITMVRPRDRQVAQDRAAGAPRLLRPGQDPFAAVQQASAGPVVVQAASPNQIALRKTSAAGIGDMVLLIAGMHALYTERNASRALAFFAEAPRNVETLRHTSEALEELGRHDAALAAVRESVRLDPRDAQSQALLGDMYMRTARWKDAADAYLAAAATSQPITTHEGAFWEGRLYGKEAPFHNVNGSYSEAAYLLGRDAETGRVIERYMLPGVAREFTATEDRLRIVFGADRYERSHGSLFFSHGQFDRPVFLTDGLLVRRTGVNVGTALAVNFVRAVERATSDGSSLGAFPPKVPRRNAESPADIGDLETAARRASEQDPTQPWHRFTLGEALWAQGRRTEAETAWQTIFTSAYPATPYYELTWMAAYFEMLGQHDWADRAFELALRKRRQMPQPIEASNLLFRLISGLPPARYAAGDLERRYLWFRRFREIAGPCIEGDDAAAAIWAAYFARHGDLRRAATETAFVGKMRHHPGNLTAAVTIADYSLYALDATAVALLVMLVLFTVRRPNAWSVRALIASISGAERRAFCVALLALVLAALWWVSSMHRVEAILLAPQSADARAHPSILAEMDGALSKYDTRERRFVAAVGHHMAGNIDRARTLYKSVLPDERADQDLAALDRGVLTPPQPATAEEIFRAAAQMSWPQWFRLVFWRRDPVDMDVMGVVKWSPPLALLRVLLLVCGALALAFFVIPSHAVDAPARAGPRRLTRIAFTAVPGAYDVRRASALLGWLVLTLFMFCGLVLAFWTAHRGEWVMGFVGDVINAGPQGFSLPTPASMSTKAVMKTYYWTWFWTQPYAAILCAVVALAAAVSLGLHVARLRRIWAV